MNETLGSLIDRLFTVDTKMWLAQDDLYRIRKMSYEDFLLEFFGEETKCKKLWEMFKKACDLNLQRNDLIDAIDEKIIEIVKDGGSDKHLQRKHKSY